MAVFSNVSSPGILGYISDSGQKELISKDPYIVKLLLCLQTILSKHYSVWKYLAFCLVDVKSCKI